MSKVRVLTSRAMKALKLVEEARCELAKTPDTHVTAAAERLAKAIEALALDDFEAEPGDE